MMCECRRCADMFSTMRVYIHLIGLMHLELSNIFAHKAPVEIGAKRILEDS